MSRPPIVAKEIQIGHWFYGMCYAHLQKWFLIKKNLIGNLNSIVELDQDQKQIVSSIATKYECVECSAKFDTPAGHRKHYQAFHGRIEKPKVIEQAEI